MKALYVLLALGVTPALAHDHGPGAWINEGKYRSPTGVHCCSPQQDCTPIPAHEIEERQNGIFLKFSGETIPYENVLKSEDEDDWRCETAMKTTRCLFLRPRTY